jgi:hypothetical protein
LVIGIKRAVTGFGAQAVWFGGDMMSYALLFLIPLSLALRFFVHAPPVWIFITAAAAIAVLADWTPRKTAGVLRGNGRLRVWGMRGLGNGGASGIFRQR